MKKSITQLSTISQYNVLAGTDYTHQLVTVLDLSKGDAVPSMTYNTGVYGVYLTEGACGELLYGKNYYKYERNSIAFTAPGQVMTQSFDPNINEQIGMALLFHPDLIKGSSLGENIQNFQFFSYDIFEALQISEEELKHIKSIFHAIAKELNIENDKYNDKVIVANLELLLTYCQRFFERQTHLIDNSNKGAVERFEKTLHNYFMSNLPIENGVPTVAYFANQLNLSPNYFGSLIKKETGCSAQEYIQSKIIDIAKEQLLDFNKTIKQISIDLGYQYPHHFTRLFKQKTGYSPNDYRLK